MVFWFAYSFDWNGTLGVLVTVLGVFSIGMAYLMSFVYGMMYLLHEMEHLIFWMNYLHHKDLSIARIAFIFGLNKLCSK